MKYPHWQYFLGLVDDVEQLSRYVELSEDNFATHSVECTRILLAAASEVDVVAKVLCQKVRPGSSPGSIVDYGEILLTSYPGIPEVEVATKRSIVTFTPWAEWTPAKRPTWWQNYNNVKHERHNFPGEGNVGNALNAVAGLCVLVTYLYHEEYVRKMLPMYRPPIFVGRKYDVCTVPLFGVGMRLPDFPEMAKK